ncbi:hypothetical protein N9385_04115 [Candidatus Nitrosopelagicus sp.]|nr:hypothetical protein [Candidatus Nitrosopelagicus sp.]
MNNKIIIFLFIGIFFLGIFFGTQIFTNNAPQHLVNQFTSISGSNIDENRTETVIDLEKFVNFKNQNDIIEKQKYMINFIWNEDELPKNYPEKIEKNFIDNRFEDLRNLESIEKITVSMEHNVKSIVYIFLAEESNQKLIIYHQGHLGGFINGKNTIQRFLDNGFSVAAFSMPLLGMNNQPVVDLKNIGSVKLLKHNQFILLDTENFSSMKFFFSPINQTLNHLFKNHSFDEFHMIGISGGGWATSVYPALDSRITKSFSVAGSIPLSLRDEIKDTGDYEHFNSEFYTKANYLELYIMNSFGNERELIQIFNKFDPCCFSNIEDYTYAKQINQILSEIGTGSFKIIIDDTHHEHKISNYIIDLIIQKSS